MLKLFRKFKEKRLKFEQSKEFNCWLDLAGNEVVMNYLKSRLIFEQDAIDTLILLDRDKKDLKKAKLLGGVKELLMIIQKAEQASNLKKKQSYAK